MRNLYEALINLLKEYGKAESDILMVTTNNKELPLDAFWVVAKNTNYNDWTRCDDPSLYVDLMLWGKDFYLMRQRNNDESWWMFIPTAPPEREMYTGLFMLANEHGEYFDDQFKAV